MLKKITNLQIEKIFNTLVSVDRNSPDLDFSIRFKNKTNFKLLKESYISLTETFEEVFEKYGEKIVENGKAFWKFGDNKELVDQEIKKIYNLEVELALTQITIFGKTDLQTNKTDTMGLNITSEQMDILEDIFIFELQ